MLLLEERERRKGRLCQCQCQCQCQSYGGENRSGGEASAVHGGSEGFMVGRRVITGAYVDCHEESLSLTLTLTRSTTTIHCTFPFLSGPTSSPSSYLCNHLQIPFSLKPCIKNETAGLVFSVTFYFIYQYNFFFSCKSFLLITLYK